MTDRRAPTTSPYDALAHDLQQLRLDGGNVSFTEVAKRIGVLREGEGRNPAAARVARSTVFDAFQSGRRRINPDLVRDIVRVLGVDDKEAEHWRRRCLDAERARLETPRASSVKTPAELAIGSPPGEPGVSAATLRIALVAAILAGCVLINLVGGAVIIRLQVPLFLDMAGTAAAAFALGPWYGVLVGVATNTLGAFISTPESIVFALVNITGALIWGYGMRRFGRSLGGFLLVTLVVAIACTLVGAPLNIVLYQGMGHSSDAWVQAMRLAEGIVPAVFSVNLLVSIADKVIVGCVGLLLSRLLLPLQLVPDAPWRGFRRHPDSSGIPNPETVADEGFLRSDA